MIFSFQQVLFQIHTMLIKGQCKCIRIKSSFIFTNYLQILITDNQFMEQKIQPNPPQIINMMQNIDNIPKSCHKNITQYQQFFSDAPTDSFTTQYLRQKLHSEGIITYNKYSDDQFFIVQAKRVGKYKQILELKVKYGSFMLKITTYIAKSQSKNHFLGTLYKANNTSIYDGGSIFPKTVVKCLSIGAENFQHIFLSVLRQICISKICYSLEASPSLKNVCEFDFVIFKDCIEIYMEKCLNISDVSLDNFTQKKVRQLKTKLKRLHSFQIVHADIKPGNICFSPSLQEFVFIDFGYSCFTGQQIGEKTLTIFMGSPGYYSEDMKQCLQSKKMSFVDLYHNDVHSLKLVLNEIYSLRMSKLNQKKQKGHLEKIIDFQDISAPLITPMQNYSELYIDQQVVKKAVQMMVQINTKYYMKNSYLHQFMNFTQNSYQLKGKEFKPNDQIAQLSGLTQLNRLQRAQNIKQIQKILLKQGQQQENQDFQHIIEVNLLKFIQMDSEYPRKYYKGYITKRNLMNMSFQLQKGYHLRQILLSKSKSESLPFQLYFQNIVSFLNFKQPISTYEQKLQAANVLLQIMNTPLDSNNNILKQVNECLFAYYLQQNDDSFIRQIPIIYSNLIILNITIEQIIRLFTLTIRKQMSLHQFFLILIGMIINTYWLILHKYTIQQLFSLIQGFKNEIKSNLRKFIEKNPQSKRDEQLCNQIVYFMRIQNIDESTGLQSQFHTSSLIGTSRFVDRQTLFKICVFNFSYHQDQLHQLASLYDFVCRLQQNSIDYYHSVFAIYYQSIECFKELNNLNKKLELCLGNRELMLNNMIYWINNPFKQYHRGQNIQLLNRNQDYLDNVLIKFSNCSKRHYKIFAEIFIYLQPITTINTPQFKQKMMKIYALAQQIFPILYEQDLWQFLQQFQEKYIHIKDRNIDNYYYQNNRIKEYSQLMIMIYSNNNRSFDIVRFLKSYINFFQKKKQQQENVQPFISYFQQEIKYHQILLYLYQQENEKYYQKVAQYFMLKQFTYKIKYRKLILLRSTIQKVLNHPYDKQSKLNENMNCFINVAVRQLIDNDGFIFYQTKMITHSHYSYIIYRLIVIMNNPDQACRVILKLLKLIHRYATKQNLLFLIQFLVMNFGNPNSQAKQYFINFFIPKITPIIINQNPIVICLYVFLKLRYKESEQQAKKLSQILIKNEKKLSPYIRLIIYQLIFYKIVRKDLQMFKHQLDKKSMQRQVKFQYFARRRYLKHPINQVQVYNYPKLLIKRYQKQYFRKRFHPKLKLLTKLNDYSQTVEGNELLIRLKFPNPFDKSQ